MPKFKVLKPFKDLRQNVYVKKDAEIDLTKERAAELEKNLDEFGGGFIEEIKAKKATKKEGD